MWGYFDDYCTEKFNFLPPDNVQFVPSLKIASRTSPTNIGMMLVSVLAARDFGFITSEELAQRVAKSLDSVDKLEKYEGNLFNWYDVTTLKTAEPRFVSAVDSGNFLCCLTALKEGLKEYQGECRELEGIIGRIAGIIDKTNLSSMYNHQRKLFHIGISPDDGKKSGSYYDMFMSEVDKNKYPNVKQKYRLEEIK
jgi:cyclic beta-1,2-glucan synthetase